jgi:hypothetical protein
MNPNKFLASAESRAAELERQAAHLRQIIEGVASGRGFVFTLRSAGYTIIGYTEAPRPDFLNSDNSAEYTGAAVAWYRSIPIVGIRGVLDV